MQNKVLVIGSSGQVASSLKRLSLSNFYFVGRPNFNICNKSHIDKVLDTIQPELVINCSAYTNVDGCESEIELAYAINSEAVKDLAIACNRRNLPLIHISTDYVFDGKQNHPYTEFNIPNPQSIYGKSKLAGEENIRNHLDQHIILRTSWLFSQYGTNFVKTMVSLAKTKKKIFVVNDQIGSPTFVDNLVVVIL
jgi:dTDP-4-dehydrorhamnose reductase